MINVTSDFNDRVQEIELYFSFMENIITKRGKILFPDGTNEQISSDLQKIFKANSFLILYNLSESCMKNAIKNIYTTIKNEGVSFDDLKKEIKLEIITSLKKHIAASRFVDNTSRIAYDIIINSFDIEKLFSGNVDAAKIRGMANKYGFSTNIPPIQESDGTYTSIDTEKMLTVKKNRNDLAHGTFSFMDCGKDYTMQDLEQIKKHVIQYLTKVLNNIQDYIVNQEYLLLSPPTITT